MKINTSAIDKWLHGEEGRERERFLATVTEVCAVPASAQRVLSLSLDDGATIKQLADAVTADPSITAQLLRIANSPVYAHSRQIQDVSRAIVMIGRSELKSTAAAVAMLAAVQPKTPLAIALNQSSVLSATLARLTAKRVDRSIDPSAAFLCGLLCEIGALACLAVDSKGYTRVYELAAGSFEELGEIELARYGAKSEEIAAHMLERNRLPPDVVEAVGTSVTTDLSVANNLKRITLFSRISASVIIDAARQGDITEMSQRIPELAAVFALPGLDADYIIEMCISAAGAAELRLRGQAVD